MASALLENLPETNPSPSSLRSGEPSRVWRETFHRNAWGRQATAWMLASTLLLWATVAALVFFYWAGSGTSPLAFDGQHTLRESVRAWVGEDIKPDYDQLSLFLSSTLPPTLNFGPDGARFRAFVKGMVSPRILADVDAYYTRQSTAIRDKGMRQFFWMERIVPEEIVFDSDSRRVSVPVRGEFVVVLERDPKAKPLHMPYMARAILSLNAPSAVNPFPFYLESLEHSSAEGAVR